MLDVRLIDEFSFKTIHDHRETIPAIFTTRARPLQ